jgi:hypothetical protein
MPFSPEISSGPGPFIGPGPGWPFEVVSLAVSQATIAVIDSTINRELTELRKDMFWDSSSAREIGTWLSAKLCTVRAKIRKH